MQFRSVSCELKHCFMADWALLCDYSGLWHYETRGRDDWSPMHRVVVSIMARPFARTIHVHNSMNSLALTTAPCYEEREGHPTIWISFSTETHQFAISYLGSNSRNSSGYRGHEDQALTLIDSFILRLAIENQFRTTVPD